MLPGDEREALRRAADRLCAELGYSGAWEAPPLGQSLLAQSDLDSMLGRLDPEDESLVAAIRRGLARMAAALSAGRPASMPKREIAVVLDATELVMRGELAKGNADQLPALMPSFVFLVAMSIVEQDEALELSRRAAQLVESMLRE
jgi:hypothetical protein